MTISFLRYALAHTVLGAVCGIALYVPAIVAHTQYRRTLAWEWATALDARQYLDNRYYFAVRDSTRALIRRKYRGDTTTPRALAYFRHMDSAYDPTYMLTPRRRNRCHDVPSICRMIDEDRHLIPAPTTRTLAAAPAR